MPAISVILADSDAVAHLLAETCIHKAAVSHAMITTSNVRIIARSRGEAESRSYRDRMILKFLKVGCNQRVQNPCR